MLWFFLQEDAHSSRFASNLLNAMLRRFFTGWTILQWLHIFFGARQNGLAGGACLACTTWHIERLPNLQKHRLTE
jgi:hypothetical protein